MGKYNGIYNQVLSQFPLYLVMPSYFIRLIVRTITIILLIASPVRADECNFPHFNSRPLVQESATEVRVGIFVINILNVDDHEETYAVDFYLQLEWNDPRLVHEGREDICILTLDDVWDPNMRLHNQYHVEKGTDDIVHINPDGKVIYRQRFTGELISTTDISDFPFDSRTLPISFVAVGYSPADVQLVFDTKHSGRSDIFSIPNWVIGEDEPHIGKFEVITGKQFARFDFNFEATRRSTYFIWSALVPLIIIIFMSWGVFWINPRELGPQLSLAAMSMLTLTTYRFTLANILPPVSYLTRMDIFVLGASLLIFLALGEAILTGALASRGKTEIAIKLDYISRYIFPLTFLILIFCTFMVGYD